MNEVKYILGIEEYYNGEYHRNKLLDTNIKIADYFGYQVVTDFYERNIIYYIWIDSKELALILRLLIETL